MANQTNTSLPLTSCVLLDLPESHLDCSIYNEQECIRCASLGKFITGETVNEFSSAGHIICVILWLITAFVGICGFFGNILIIHILHRQKRGTAFDSFLAALAWIDMACCVTCVVTTTAAVVYFENLSRGAGSLYFFWLGSHSALFAKSGSSFMTVMITIERYFAIAFPLKSRLLTNTRRTRILVAAVIFFSFLMAIPRYSSMKIGQNMFLGKIDSVKNLEYLIMSTSLNRFWYGTMKGFFNQVDFWLPLPLLLLSNGLVYLHILKFASRRQEMNLGQRKEIRAVKMFLPVVIVLFLCNVIPIIHYAFIQGTKTAYRELHMAIFASFAFNSAANLPIYYCKGSGFRKETRGLLTQAFPFLENWLPKMSEGNTTSGTASGSAA